jgi:hypothetical protein
MPRYVRGGVVQDALHRHPAVQAWRTLGPEHRTPDSVHILKERRRGKTGKSAVYRLTGVGYDDSAVVAKRCQKDTGLIERTIYQDILPRLPMPHLHYYGFLEEPGGKVCWLFLQDAGEQAYLPHNLEHRTVAAQWLGLVHVSVPLLTSGSCFPDRGPAHYLEHMKRARDTLVRNPNNRALDDDDLRMLESIVSHSDILETRWNQIERFCNRIPCTLVHGDFSAKNVRLRNGPDGVALLPLDWEKAGWGVPAADLEQLDVSTYWSVIRNVWSEVDLQDLQRLAHLGRIFRCLAALGWDSRRLEYHGVERVMWRMRSYESRLADLVQTAEWRM